MLRPEKQTQPGGAGSQGANAVQAGETKDSAVPNVDIDQARSFLRALDPKAERFHFRTFSDRGGQGRTYYGSLDELETELRLANGNGSGVFVVVNEGGQTKDAITRVRAVWADFDDESAMSRLRNDPYALHINGAEPHLVVESSPGKLHVYWLVNDFPLDSFTPVQQAIATRYASDHKVSDLPHVMRVPGFIHHKGKPVLTRLRHVAAQPRFSASQILTAFPPAQGMRSPVFSVAADATEYATPEQVIALRSALNFMRADDRQQWVANGVRLKSLGEVGRGLWVDWARTSDKWQPEDAKEWDTFRADRTGFRAVFAAAQNQGWQNPSSTPARFDVQAAEPHPPLFTALGELLTRDLKPNWLVRTMLERNSLACLFGVSGGGKTFIALDIALSVSVGRDYHGQPVAQAPVLYIAGEGHSGLTRRAIAWGLHHGLDLANTPLHISRVGVALTDRQVVAATLAEIDSFIQKHEAPGLIVVDTLARNFGSGDENSTPDMNAFVTALDAVRKQTGACVLVVHHTSKANADAARGSGVLRAAMDWEYSASPDAGAVRLLCTKAKDFEPPGELCFRIVGIDLGEVDDEGQPITSAFLSHVPTLPRSKAGASGRGKHQTAAMRILHTLLTEADAGDRPEEVAYDLWQVRCREEEKIPPKRFTEAAKGLAKAGQIEVHTLDNGISVVRLGAGDAIDPINMEFSP